MKTKLLQCCFCILFFLALSVRSEAIKGFTPITQDGDCTINVGNGFVPVNIGRLYPFGNVVKTGRNSFIDLQFTAGNTFRLLARSSVTITEDTKDPKLKVIQLSKGTVDLKLDNFPADHKLQVETPTAICGAVGTTFKVSFEDESIPGNFDKGNSSRSHFVAVEEGEVSLASRFTVNDEVVIGQSFSVEGLTAGSEMVAQIEEGSDNAYTDVTVNRGRLRFNYGGDEGVTFDVEAREGSEPPRFTAALTKDKDGLTFVAIKMLSGDANFIFFGGTGASANISTADGAVLVPTRKPKAGEKAEIVPGGADAETFINNAGAEAGEYSVLVDLKNSGASNESIQNQQNKVNNSKQNTNSTKNQIETNILGQTKTIDQQNNDDNTDRGKGKKSSSGDGTGTQGGGTTTNTTQYVTLCVETAAGSEQFVEESIVSTNVEARQNQLRSANRRFETGQCQRVTICHIPPGNPNNPITIEIGRPALQAHLAHGDEQGPCTVICHFPIDPNTVDERSNQGVSTTILPSKLNEHLGHGDHTGSCTPSSKPISPNQP